MESQPQSTTKNCGLASTSQKVSSDVPESSVQSKTGNVTPSGSFSAGKMCLLFKTI